MYTLFRSVAVVFVFMLSSGVCRETDSRSFHKSFEERWVAFHGDEKQFPLWTPNWTEKELQGRFDQMMSDRWTVYFVNPEDCRKSNAIGRYKKEYQTPENWTEWGSRYPYPGAFSYNLATPSYNASLVTLCGRDFLAMEAPTKENLTSFYGLLNQYKVTDLVRLTPAVSGGRENSFPYWEGHINISPKDGRSTIELGGREMRYFCTDCWENHKGLEPDRLMALVKAIMVYESSDQMIAIHCRAGVGRTGTLLAAFALIHDIDAQHAQGVSNDNIRVSIDKIVWQLSLQRPFLVTHFHQYVSLYTLVGFYLSRD